jgi:hypothetical protein
MSISSMTTLAVARDLRPPTKADTTERTPESSEGKDQPSGMAILAKTVPTGYVAAYTAFLAAVEIAVKPTTENPEPAQLLPLRWAVFAVLVIGSAITTVVSYNSKAKPAASARTLPGVELAAVVVAATAWGLGAPESPLLAGIDDTAARFLVLAAVVAIGLMINVTLSQMLKKSSADAGAS